MTREWRMISRVFINHRGEPRVGWRILLYVGIVIICGFGLLSLYSSTAGYLSFGGMPERRGNLIPEYVLLSAAGLVAAFPMLRFVDKRPFSALGFALHERVWTEIGQGILHASVLVSCIFLVEWELGGVNLSRWDWNATETLHHSAYYFVLFVFAGGFEEIAARGYVFQALVQGIGKPAAVGIGSIVFGLAHAANPHVSMLSVINTVLAGVWLSVAYLRTRSLWLPTSLHVAWNLILGYVYGFPLSGVPLTGTMVRLSDRGPVWLTGGDYGPEAGAVATVVLVSATFYLWRSKRIRPSERAVALWHTNTGEILPRVP